jgi:hypothetical protein
MRKKRILIIGLVLLFLVSTNGMPITYHLCEMMGEKALSECEVCVVEKQKVETSCCVEESSDLFSQISASESTCCFDSFTYEKIEDDFSQSGNLKTISNSVIIVLKPLVLDTEEIDKYSHQNNYSLPPPKFGKQLLRSIHQLKIDISNC